MLAKLILLLSFQEVLINLVDAKKWKLALTSLPEEIVTSTNPKVKLILSFLIGAKLKQTSREKRKAQMADRKFIVRVIFQVFGQARSVEFLHDFVSKEAPFLGTVDNSQAIDMGKKLGMIFDVLVISAQSAGGVHSVFKDILDVLVCEGQLLIKTQKTEPLLLAKPRSKLMEHVLTVMFLEDYWKLYIAFIELLHFFRHFARYASVSGPVTTLIPY